MYTMADLVNATGVTARTIRSYIATGYLEKPEGHGPGAVYTEEHYLRAIALVRMRAAGEGWKVIAERIPEWSLQKVRAYVKKTDPPAPAPPPPPEPAPPPGGPGGAPLPAAQADSTPALEGEPATPRRRLPRGGAPHDGLEVSSKDDDGWLPDGPRWLPVPLLPGLALWVRDDAAPLVRRVASEIVRRYGSR
jgi:DNA-binding transcriptional MerR regulator